MASSTLLVMAFSDSPHTATTPRPDASQTAAASPDSPDTTRAGGALAAAPPRKPKKILTAPKPRAPVRPAYAVQPDGSAWNQIAIPALYATAPIDVPCIVHDGEIEPPSTDPRRTCVWDGGGQLGSTTGTEMILGHINYSGVDGALGRIGTLPAGSRIFIWNSAGRRSVWSVTLIHQRAKADGVDPGAEVGPRGPARLVLVTCGGAWIGGHFGYADLIWVYADPA
ncbi:MAG: class F sortase [Actinomycetota bacterium]